MRRAGLAVVGALFVAAAARGQVCDECRRTELLEQILQADQLTTQLLRYNLQGELTGTDYWRPSWDEFRGEFTTYLQTQVDLTEYLDEVETLLGETALETSVIEQLMAVNSNTDNIENLLQLAGQRLAALQAIEADTTVLADAQPQELSLLQTIASNTAQSGNAALLSVLEDIEVNTAPLPGAVDPLNPDSIQASVASLRPYLANLDAAMGDAELANTDALTELVRIATGVGLMSIDLAALNENDDAILAELQEVNDSLSGGVGLADDFDPGDDELPPAYDPQAIDNVTEGALVAHGFQALPDFSSRSVTDEPDLSFSIPDYIGGAWGYNGLAIDLTADLSIFSQYRAQFHALIMAFVVMWGMGRLFEEFRRM